LIVFTIKNSRTDTVYVGTTKDSIDERWALYQLAKDLAIEGHLYRDMRKHGVACFTIEEYDFAESREELAEMFEEAMDQFDGTSLKGLKTSLPRTAVYPTTGGAEPKRKVAAKAADVSTAAKSTTVKSTAAKSSANKSGPVKQIFTAKTAKSDVDEEPVTKLKLSSGRTGSAIREKKIKEVIELEKEARTALKMKQIADQADEMKAILTNLDSRGSTLRKRN
jgi:hypothetical protein